MDLEKPIIPLMIFLFVSLILFVGVVFKFVLNDDEKQLREQENYAKKFDNTFHPAQTQEEMNSKVFTNLYGDYPWSLENRGEVD